MKKILLILVALMVSMTTMAQNDDLSPETKQFQDEVMSFLKTEGYAPYIDEDDGSLCFKKEGELYWIFFYDDNPTFVEFHYEGLNTETADALSVYKAVNDVNRIKRCVKAYVSSSGNSVGFTIEFYAKSSTNFSEVFSSNMRVFSGAKDFCKEKYAEYSGE
ncbi:MAG: YbjN domain-containing protein [Bacteroidales bacterium]|nr:YbjN domain-containing protein [Bacteroidales bacterium]